MLGFTGILPGMFSIGMMQLILATGQRFQESSSAVKSSELKLVIVEYCGKMSL